MDTSDAAGTPAKAWVSLISFLVFAGMFIYCVKGCMHTNHDIRVMSGESDVALDLDKVISDHPSVLGKWQVFIEKDAMVGDWVSFQQSPLDLDSSPEFRPDLLVCIRTKNKQTEAFIASPNISNYFNTTGAKILIKHGDDAAKEYEAHGSNDSCELFLSGDAVDELFRCLSDESSVKIRFTDVQGNERDIEVFSDRIAKYFK